MPSTAPDTSSQAAGDFIKPNVGTFTPAQPSQPSQHSPAHGPVAQPILGTTEHGTITRGLTRVVRCPYITLHRLSRVMCHVSRYIGVMCHVSHEVTCLLTVGLVIKYTGRHEISTKRTQTPMLPSTFSDYFPDIAINSSILHITCLVKW